MKKIYHGSKSIIEMPIFGYGKKYNDYGLGFYCTEDQELAKEWAVEKERGGFCNCYELDTTDLRIMNLNSDQYTLLHWLTMLILNRSFDVQSDFGREAFEYLEQHFSLDLSLFDVIIGYRADDSYFSFAQDFLNNMISLNSLAQAMALGKLGEQIVLKSQTAFERICYVGSEAVSSEKWYIKKEMRDRKAREDYKKVRSQRFRRGELYIMQIIDEEVKADDVRLRPEFIV